MRFAVIGAGFGANHLSWLAECDGVTVEALCYRNNATRARELARRFDVPRTSDDVAKVIADGGIDAIAVASPPDTHEELIGLGLDAGLTVVTDKPLTTDVDSAARLARRGRAASAMITFQWRANPAFDRLRELCAGPLGPLARVDLEFHHDFLAGPTTSWPWRHRLASAGAGTLGDQGVHLFDLLRWLAPGRWSVVHGSATVMYPRRAFDGLTLAAETEDIAEVLLADDAGPTRSRVLVSRVSTGRREVRIVAQGAGGVAEVRANSEDGSATLAVTTADGGAETARFGPNSMNPYRALLDSNSVADFEDGYRAQVLLDDAMRRGCGAPSVVAG
ncbi:Gfo/Idh/MocA family protein [Kutzneria buriramensis]|uniref:Putative dehydrogenase n=1 Tax=Kutzneria buriramensis TaxID=1045776 RepID=A0A3E0G7T4_9PSEU|nr:Gfo/Idh/MocA family oxidoreductase [Kutzneria buriramensis]REH18148.1 putative dehydrogenase [Kutzneria buriramensis]